MQKLKSAFEMAKNENFRFFFFRFSFGNPERLRTQRADAEGSIHPFREPDEGRGRSGFGPVASIAGRAGPVEERSGDGRWPSDEKRRRARPVSRDFFLFSFRKRIGRAKFPFRPKTFDSVGMGEKFFFRKKTARGAGNRARPSFRFAEVRNWSKREKGKSSDGGRRGAKGATKAG